MSHQPEYPWPPPSAVGDPHARHTQYYQQQLNAHTAASDTVYTVSPRDPRLTRLQPQLLAAAMNVQQPPINYQPVAGYQPSTEEDLQYQYQQEQVRMSEEYERFLKTINCEKPEISISAPTSFGSLHQSSYPSSVYPLPPHGTRGSVFPPAPIVEGNQPITNVANYQQGVSPAEYNSFFPGYVEPNMRTSTIPTVPSRQPSNPYPTTPSNHKLPYDETIYQKNPSNSKYTHFHDQGNYSPTRNRRHSRDINSHRESSRPQPTRSYSSYRNPNQTYSSPPKSSNSRKRRYESPERKTQNEPTSTSFSTNWTSQRSRSPSPSYTQPDTHSVGISTSNQPPTSNVFPTMVEVDFFNCIHGTDSGYARCNKTLPSLFCLNQHVFEAHKINEHRCPLKDCRFSSNKTSKLIKHRARVHSKLTVWPCNRSLGGNRGHCLKSFNSQHELADHFENEHMSGRFTCTFDGCDFVATECKQVVKDHFNEVHRGVKNDEKDNTRQQPVIEEIVEESPSPKRYKTNTSKLFHDAVANLKTQAQEREFEINRNPKHYFTEPISPDEDDDSQRQQQSVIEEIVEVPRPKEAKMATLKTQIQEQELETNCNSKQFSKEPISTIQDNQQQPEIGRIVGKTPPPKKVIKSKSFNDTLATLRTEVEQQENSTNATSEQNSLEPNEMVSDGEVLYLGEPIASFPIRPTHPKPKRERALFTPPSSPISTLPTMASSPFYKIEYLCCLKHGCDVRPTSTDTLNEHMEAVHGIHLYRCPIHSCRATFSERNQLQEHNASEHAFLSSWPCTSTCGLEFSTSESLSEHITMAHFEGIFHCTVEGCPYQAITRSMVVQHTQKEHLVVTGQGSEQVKYSTITLSCPEDDCSEFFLTEDILNKHMINAHGKFPFVCLLSQCMQTFNSRFQLNQHLESANIQVSQWPCSKCDHQTVSHQALYDHDRLVHQKGLFKCAFPLCSKLRQSRQDIVLHFDSSHSTANK